MADIVQGLFGLSPFDIQQQQAAGLQKNAMQYAQMNPYQQATSSLYQAGGMLGGAAAEGMGMVNPQLEQAKVRAAVMGQGGDLTTAEGLKAKAAQFAAAGDQQTALRLVMLAKKREEEEADINLKKAHAKYYEQGGARSTANVNSQLAAKQAIARNDAMKFGLNSGMKGQELLDFVEMQVQRVTDTWNATTGSAQASPTTGNINLSDRTEISPNLSITEEQKAAMIADAQQRGDLEAAAKIQQLPVTRAVALPKSKAEVAGEVKLAETLASKDPAISAREAKAKEEGKGSGEANVKQHDTVLVAVQSIPKIDKLIEQLNKGDTMTGMAADIRLGIARAQALLGGKDGAAKAKETQIADVLMGADVFPLIQSLGIGARGMDTPAEREFMRNVLTGTISLEKDTLLEMAKMRKEALTRNITQWNDRIDKGELDSYFSNTGRTKEKVSVKKEQTSLDAMPSPSTMSGKVIRDTVTGIRYKSDGTKWVKQ